MKYIWEFMYYEVMLYTSQGHTTVKMFYSDKEFDSYMKENYDYPMEVRRVSRLVCAEYEEE